MKVAGLNRHFQLGECMNKISPYGHQIVYPPFKSHINVSDLLSFSAYSQHTVWVTKDKKAYALGDNIDGQISDSIPKEVLRKDTEVFINDKDGNKCQFLSAVCGTFYTLYLISGQTENDPPRLVYCKSGKPPLFLNLNGRIIKAIYGGRCVCAAMDTEGGIIMISHSSYDSIVSDGVKPTSLPNGEKPIKIACCNKYVNVLSSAGHVFRSTFPKNGILNFEQVMEISQEKIVDISTSFHHCFVVTSEGKVFGIGNNSYSILGFPKNVKKVDKFTEVKSLKKFKIVESFAGFSHSIFKTDDGKIIAVGMNSCGEMLINRKNVISRPVKTRIKDKVSFVIAGEYLTILFVDDIIPPNMPNMKHTCD